MTSIAASTTTRANGRFHVEDGVKWYVIDDYDLLDPFLVTLVTPTDQWMFVSSSGALTAGRRTASRALFPYETDDRLHRAAGHSGPLTIIRAGGELWEPFAPHVSMGAVRRSIAKSAEGDRLRFREHHPGLGLTFSYEWATADRFGFIRTCHLSSDDQSGIDVELLDGLVDILPAGVDDVTQQTTSTLVDAYRRSEYRESSEVAVFTLEALISDRPEPAESLRSTIVWSRGLQSPTVALSDRQVRRFRSGEPLASEHLVKGRKGAFLMSSSGVVASATPMRWGVVADVEQTHRDLAELGTWLAATDSPESEVGLAVEASSRDLVEIAAAADALQESADRRSTTHHFANVLFNVMRGGLFLEDHRVAAVEVAAFVKARNEGLSDRFEATAAALDAVVEIGTLKDAVRDDADLARLVAEYLPLRFSRRHGDPSRPWNAFEISPATAAGEPGHGYEGNWRDIFQNWEALLYSFPEYSESVIAKFLNASTVDGFNPYRLTEAGIDWEMPEDGAWSNFGYWGDHQIAYLHRLLDVYDRFHPGELESGLDRVWLSYADVPYRILPYEQIAADPKTTIVFDHPRQAEVDERVAKLGEDGRLVPNAAGVHLASLGEKLLVPALAKLSNLVAGAGIWMNTQRPEWNDANNALVGNGVSTVTAVYLREYLGLLDRLFAATTIELIPVGEQVSAWIDGLRRTFERHQVIADSDDIDPGDRRALLDGLGTVFSDYRAIAYRSGPGKSKLVGVEALRALLDSARPFLDQVVRCSVRSDGLAEAYCLLRLEPDTAHVDRLYEMLEGQVAVLSTGDMDIDAVVELVDAMFASPLYRDDQHTFLLYPDRSLPAFWAKNVVPDSLLGPVANVLLESASGILYRDEEGVVRFEASLCSAREVASALELADLDGGPLDRSERQEILDLYESVFHHKAFTGRSGTMYRYEGLGSVYWHMVSKLLLALQEKIFGAIEAGEPPAKIGELSNLYHRVRDGLGYRKDVVEQGTFPTDPHSHTPAHTGAQQPGMTGQVKEGVLLRWGELGVHVEGGCLRFRPAVLSPSEFLLEPRAWDPLGPGAILEPGTLGFTYCAVPIVYRLSDDQSWTRVHWSDGGVTEGSERLDAATSRALFLRRGLIDRIEVGIPRSWLRWPGGASSVAGAG